MAVNEVHDLDFVIISDDDGFGSEIGVNNISIGHNLQSLDDLPGDRFLYFKKGLLLASLRLSLFSINSSKVVPSQ